MAGLAPVRRRVLLKVLRLNGFVEEPGRGKGSHAWFRRPDDPGLYTTVPNRETIDVDLLGRILKQAGKDRREYEQRLREV